MKTVLGVIGVVLAVWANQGVLAQQVLDPFLVGGGSSSGGEPVWNGPSGSRSECDKEEQESCSDEQILVVRNIDGFYFFRTKLHESPIVLRPVDAQELAEAQRMKEQFLITKPIELGSGMTPHQFSGQGHYRVYPEISKNDLVFKAFQISSELENFEFNKEQSAVLVRNLPELLNTELGVEEEAIELRTLEELEEQGLEKYDERALRLTGSIER